MAICSINIIYRHCLYCIYRPNITRHASFIPQQHQKLMFTEKINCVLLGDSWFCVTNVRTGMCESALGFRLLGTCGWHMFWSWKTLSPVYIQHWQRDECANIDININFLWKKFLVKMTRVVQVLCRPSTYIHYCVLLLEKVVYHGLTVDDVTAVGGRINNNNNSFSIKKRNIRTKLNCDHKCWFNQ